MISDLNCIVRNTCSDKYYSLIKNRAFCCPPRKTSDVPPVPLKSAPFSFQPPYHSAQLPSSKPKNNKTPCPLYNSNLPALKTSRLYKTALSISSPGLPNTEPTISSCSMRSPLQTLQSERLTAMNENGSVAFRVVALRFRYWSCCSPV